MNKAGHNDLIQRALDDQLSNEEKTRLDEYLNANRDAGAHYRAMQAAVKEIRQIPLVEPPANLSRHIMKRVSQEKRKISGSILFYSRLRQFVQFLFPDRRVALAFACGLLIGIAALLAVVSLD
jgi:anti-sigma factor RsiW